MYKLQIVAPATPGATPTVVGTCNTLAQARQIAAKYDSRRDLRGQDVRIEWSSGKLVEYAGPAR